MSFRRYALIMAGGKGTRFWPISKNQCPKQYLALNNEKSLLENTLERVAPLVTKEARFIVTVAEQAELALTHSKTWIPKENLILEPAGRNTAPCILLALAQLEARGAKADDVIAILPADHVILNTQSFEADLEQAYGIAAKHGKIVTIGIPPHFPHTGFGYIQKEKKLGDNLYEVSAFKEKPELNVAKQYLQSGDYFWNAGMFVAGFGTLLTEFKTHAKEQFEFYQKLKELCESHLDVSLLYKQMPANSIDYAVMEKSNKVLVIKAGFDWNDLGSWDALESVNTPIKNNILLNKLAEQNLSYIDNSQNNIIYSPQQLLAISGLEGYIVVSTPEVLMILRKDEAQKVKEVYQWVSTHSELSKLC